MVTLVPARVVGKLPSPSIAPVQSLVSVARFVPKMVVQELLTTPGVKDAPLVTPFVGVIAGPAPVVRV
jgi:hypothetical protein